MKLSINVDFGKIKDMIVYGALETVSYILRLIGCLILFTNFIAKRVAKEVIDDVTWLMDKMVNRWRYIQMMRTVQKPVMLLGVNEREVES